MEFNVVAVANGLILMNFRGLRKYSKKYNLARKQKFLVPSEAILSALPASIIAILFSVNTIHIPVLIYPHLIIIFRKQIVEFHPNIINKQSSLEGGRH